MFARSYSYELNCCADCSQSWLAKSWVWRQQILDSNLPGASWQKIGPNTSLAFVNHINCMCVEYPVQEQRNDALLPVGVHPGSVGFFARDTMIKPLRPNGTCPQLQTLPGQNNGRSRLFGLKRDKVLRRQ